MAGFVKLYRELKDTPLWINANSVTRDVMITLMLNACYKETEWNEYGRVIVLHPGQMVLSLNEVTMKCAKGATYKQIRGAMDYLKRAGFLETSRAKKKTLITLTGWEKFQPENEARAESRAESRAECGQDDVHNVGNKSAICGHDEQHNEGELIKEEYKNKENNNIYNITGEEKTESDEAKKKKKKFVRPGVDDVDSFFKENGFDFNTRDQAERFVDYYEANGWTQGKSCKPLKSWKAAARNWARNVRSWNYGSSKTGNSGINSTNEKKRNEENWGDITEL